MTSLGVGSPRARGARMAFSARRRVVFWCSSAVMCGFERLRNSLFLRISQDQSARIDASAVGHVDDRSSGMCSKEVSEVDPHVKKGGPCVKTRAATRVHVCACVCRSGEISDSPTATNALSSWESRCRVWSHTRRKHASAWAGSRNEKLRRRTRFVWIPRALCSVCLACVDRMEHLYSWSCPIVAPVSTSTIVGLGNSCEEQPS